MSDKLKRYADQMVYWEGGGYDGCIWEPNMGFIDDESEWHPVISTGRGAIDDEDTLLEAIHDPDNWRWNGFRRMPISQKSADWFCKNIRLDFVAFFIDKINAYIAEDTRLRLLSGKHARLQPLEMICTKCGKHFIDLEYEYQDIISMMNNVGHYTGDGGIGIITTDIYCEGCLAEEESCDEE